MGRRGRGGHLYFSFPAEHLVKRGASSILCGMWSWLVFGVFDILFVVLYNWKGLIYREERGYQNTNFRSQILNGIQIKTTSY